MHHHIQLYNKFLRPMRTLSCFDGTNKCLSLNTLWVSNTNVRYPQSVKRQTFICTTKTRQFEEKHNGTQLDHQALIKMF